LHFGCASYISAIVVPALVFYNCGNYGYAGKNRHWQKYAD